MKKYLAIDIGGTYIKLGIVTEDGEITARSRVETVQDGKTVMSALLSAVRSFLAEQGLSATALEGIGVSSPGCVDTVNGCIGQNGGNVPGWSGAKVVEAVEAAFGRRTTLVNDANAAALGEAWTGAAKGCSDVVCITLGTGVGGGIITGGRLLNGRRGYAGEFGHFPMFPGAGMPEGDELEHFTSASALVKKASAVDPAWDGGQSIFASVEAGDETARAIVDAWLDLVAAGIAGLVYTFDPEVVLVGGGVSAQEELLIRPLQEKVLGNIMPDFAEGLEIRAAALGNDAGLAGAVKFFIDSAE